MITPCFFVSNRPVEEDVPKEDTDIRKVEKTSEGWGNLQHIEILSSPRNKWFPTTADMVRATLAQNAWKRILARKVQQIYGVRGL